MGRDMESFGPIEAFIPLRVIFPIDKRPRLRHFGLSRFLVTKDDIMSFLSALQPTLRLVELGYLSFIDGGGIFAFVLRRMRDDLGWRERPADERPRVSISVDAVNLDMERTVLINNEVQSFLYHDGDNLCGPGDIPYVNSIDEGTSIVRDEFDPDHERPHADQIELVKLGIIEPDEWDSKLMEQGFDLWQDYSRSVEART
ncbi:hypothetical protein EDB80DRAFT_689185 [Ilyonectria destructans]|nr:hypothetical protein EDB80DRAFT_689185 [Ilyonectria destructans]